MDTVTRRSSTLLTPCRQEVTPRDRWRLCPPERMTPAWSRGERRCETHVEGVARPAARPAGSATPHTPATRAGDRPPPRPAGARRGAGRGGRRPAAGRAVAVGARAGRRAGAGLVFGEAGRARGW